MLISIKAVTKDRKRKRILISLNEPIFDDHYGIFVLFMLIFYIILYLRCTSRLHKAQLLPKLPLQSVKCCIFHSSITIVLISGCQ